MSLLTTNMGLSSWDLGQDPYDFSQLANNWLAIDNHDHTTGKGRQIPTNGIQDNAVTTAKIADGAVTGPKIPDGTITQTKLAANSVGPGQIIDGSVGTAELANGSVTPAKVDPKLYIIGEVIDWYRPNSSIPIPTGLEVCDGRPWSTIPNAWGVTTGNIPDLRNKFVLGAATTNNGSLPTQNPDIGQIGGSHTLNLSHSHAVTGPTLTVASHSHSIGSDGSHSHGITVATGGSHIHSIALGGTHSHDFLNNDGSGHGPLWIRELGTDANESATTLHPTVPGYGTKTMYHPGSSGDPFNIGNRSEAVEMADAPQHNHGGSTGPNGDHTHTASSDPAGTHNHSGLTGSSTATTNAITGTTDSQLATVDTRPGYVGLLKLMRVL